VQGPLSQSVAASEAFTLSVSMAGGFPTYQSIWSRDGVILLTNVATTTNAFFTETAPAVPGIYSYMVEVRGGANPTPSRASANIAVMADMDSDGLPDEWEKIFGLSDADPADAALDGDNDGLDNRQEYAAGTNPTDGLSKLSLEIAVGSVAILRFEGIQNKTYSLEFTDALGEGSWVKFSDHAAQASTRWETASDALVSNRYYRLVTPRKP
jgi:hypothetical protein